MIRISDVSLGFEHSPAQLQQALAKRLNISSDFILSYTIIRRAIDARHKNNILAVYTIDVAVENEEKILAGLVGDSKITIAAVGQYQMPISNGSSNKKPVVVGSGPCGLFIALLLAQAGLKPVLIERGQPIKQRIKDINAFWRDGILNSESNIQFGQGGAGTFSDGKLTTQIKDKSFRCRKVIDELVKAGAPQEIAYKAKPHIGTDNLINIVENICQEIIALGGAIHFASKLTAIEINNGKVCAVQINNKEIIATDTLALAIGHSARDTFAMLLQYGVQMSAKPFAMGVRIEHPQILVDKSQYGHCAGHPLLGPAEYKLVQHCPNGRAVYSFCMCPGGKVIAASSQPGTVVINGMSFYKRNCVNANSALLVGVETSDLASDNPLAGIALQEIWEKKAFELAGGNYYAPAQLVGDFLQKQASTKTSDINPSYEPGVTFCDIDKCLPDFISETLRLALPLLDKKLKGFARPDAVMTAIESRSSSPVRIVRDADCQSVNIKGLFPAGEGAGYAGGIMSAAVDGLKVAEAIISKCE